MTKEKKGKIVSIKESDLVNLIEKIVETAVTDKKAEWLSEQEKKGSTKKLEETITNIVNKKLSKK